MCQKLSPEIWCPDNPSLQINEVRINEGPLYFGWSNKFAYGLPCSPSKSLDLHYTNTTYKMLWLFATAGNHCNFPLHVIVAQSFPLNILCHVPRVDFPLLDIMTSETYLITFLQKSAMTFVLDQIFRPSMELFLPVLQTLKMR